jgi:hypothetical protein
MVAAFRKFDSFRGLVVEFDPVHARLPMKGGGKMRVPAVMLVTLLVAGSGVGNSSALYPMNATPLGALMPAEGAPPQSGRVTVPSGTEIVVRLIDGIDSTKTGLGERFRASIDDPVVVGDRVVIPRNADASVQIVKAEKSSELFVKLYDVTVNGKSYDVVSNYAQLKAPGKGSSYAKRTVGLGALGAAIGGIAGGGKGAAIGAVSGAGLGAVTVAAKGSKVQLPSESRLSFQLRAALPLK